MNKLTTLFLKVILVAATLVSSTASLWAQDGSTYICHAIGIEGFETQHAEAGAYKGKTTKELREMRVYIAVKGDDLYIDSNFIPPGRNFDHPTKIRTSEQVLDLQSISKFLVDDNGVVQSEQTFRQAFEQDVRFFVDHKVFQHAKYKNLSFSGAQHVQLIGTDRVPLPTRVIAVANGRERVVEVGQSLFLRANEPDISKLILQLKSKPFNKHDARILSLVTNRATNEAISNQNRIQFDWTSPEDLRTTLASNRDRAIFAVGHVENDAFVVIDASNKVLMTVPINELLGMAREFNIDLFAIGCNSAACGRPGIPGEFNTLDAVGNLNRAINSSATNFDFLNSLASDNLALVIDNTVLSGTRSRINISAYPRLGATVTLSAAGAAAQIIFTTVLPEVDVQDLGPPPSSLLSDFAAALVEMVNREFPDEPKPYRGKTIYVRERELSARALTLPPPAAVTKNGRAILGRVAVRVTVDEQGNVIKSRAISGPLRLRSSAVAAAQEAKFAPFKRAGQEVRVIGIIRYTFREWDW